MDENYEEMLGLAPRWMEEQKEEAERAIVASILIDQRCLPDIREAIDADMFSNKTLRTAYIVSCALRDDGRDVDPVSLGAGVVERGVDWTNAYCMQLIDETVTAANALAYCEILKKEDSRRKLLGLLNEQRAVLLNGGDPEDARRDISSFLENEDEGSKKKGIVSSQEVATTFLGSVIEAQEGKREPALRTGYRHLDKMLEGGLQRNGFYVLAARPGRGKTAFALNIAYRVAKRGKRVLFISLEMDREQLMSRIVSSEVGVLGPAQILNGRFSGQELTDRVVDSVSRIAKLPIWYNRADRLNAQDIKHLARLSKAEFIVIDYLGLVEYENEKGRPYEEVTKISRKLKSLARSIGSPILCLAQLNRESEKREGGKPILSDLRETGAIEQDADGVIFNLPASDKEVADMSWAQDNPSAWPLKVIVAKNRHGATGEIEMNWYKQSGRIVEG